MTGEEALRTALSNDLSPEHDTPFHLQRWLDGYDGVGMKVVVPHLSVFSFFHSWSSPLSEATCIVVT
ncbi:unnamed protein product, partial [Cylicostephanus goldi]